MEQESEASELNDVLAEMAAYEKNAPSVNVAPSHEPDAPSVKFSPSVSASKKVSPYSIGMLITTAAALFTLIVYIHFVTPRQSVAIVTDSIGAQWQGAKDVDTGLLFNNTDEPWILKRGIVEIEFDSGAHVVVEAPCEFTCKSDNQIELSYGRIYARVPSWAIGFTVQTGNSRIVDLGTEFGVLANVDGTTEAHVFKGLTKVLTGRSKDSQAISVTAGQAKQVPFEGGQVEDIKLKENSFAQQIDSGLNLIRRGQKTLDIADIIGGGNGLGTGHRNRGIDPETGIMGQLEQFDRNTDNFYHTVKEHPFIDGVFVPNGVINQVVTSAGHIFKDCPVTQSCFYSDLSYSPSLVDGASVMFDGVNYSNSGSALFMHANLGVTYDLQKIRSIYDGINITSFSAKIGVCESSWRPCNADFWVLVDGQLRYSKQNVNQKGVIDEIMIGLSDKDHFLTIVTTDGGDAITRNYLDGQITSMDSDWCIFAEPVLTIK